MRRTHLTEAEIRALQENLVLFQLHNLPLLQTLTLLGLNVRLSLRLPQENQNEAQWQDLRQKPYHLILCGTDPNAPAILNVDNVDIALESFYLIILALIFGAIPDYNNLGPLSHQNGPLKDFFIMFEDDANGRRLMREIFTPDIVQQMRNALQNPNSETIFNLYTVGGQDDDTFTDIIQGNQLLFPDNHSNDIQGTIPAAAFPIFQQHVLSLLFLKLQQLSQIGMPPLWFQGIGPVVPTIPFQQGLFPPAPAAPAAPPAGEQQHDPQAGR